MRDHGRHRRMAEGSRCRHRHRHCVVRAWRWNGPFGASGTRESAMLTPVTPPPRRCDPPTRESVPLTIGIRDHGRHRRMAEGSRCRHRHRHCVVRAWRWNGPFGASGTRESAMLTPVTPPQRCDPPMRESVSLIIGIRDHGWHWRTVEGSCCCHRASAQALCGACLAVEWSVWGIGNT